MMKRFRTLSGLLFAALAVLLISRLLSDPTAPRFHRAHHGAAAEPYSYLSYEFLSPSPFEGGKTWIATTLGTNADRYVLYDIEKMKVLGELRNGAPVFMNRDQTRLLCVQRHSGTKTFPQRVCALLERVSFGKIRLPRSGDDVETFWVVDLTKGGATPLGSTTQLKGAGSSFSPSPRFRYAFNVPTSTLGKSGFLICDLEQRTLTTNQVRGWPMGWWDDENLILKDSNNDFVLYHMTTRAQAPLLSSRQITAFLRENDLEDDSCGLPDVMLFSIWNGRENDFYLTDTYKKWQAAQSCLVRVERPGATLRLISRDFKFEWSDHLDATGRYYVYSGREPGHTNSAVYLRDLQSNTQRTLVPPDDDTYFSLPRFYHEGVIYVRSNMLWRIDLNGSNATHLFPPPTDLRK